MIPKEVYDNCFVIDEKNLILIVPFRKVSSISIIKSELYSINIRFGEAAFVQTLFFNSEEDKEKALNSYYKYIGEKQ